MQQFHQRKPIVDLHTCNLLLNNYYCSNELFLVILWEYYENLLIDFQGILVRACVDTFTNFILSMDLYAASQTVPKGETKTLDVIKRLIDFPKQPACTLFCDNYQYN
ncbi:Hypothetical_protein [Hexamita inflata]|uniref:Hypothetical_protein n=1 Tax=Hexamita inflata TaxID=28002 RepID=A0AA86N4S4_9EUKA|nr:Hypothetical protein HINF_LOCUS413 [Hexamita inflata]